MENKNIKYLYAIKDELADYDIAFTAENDDIATRLFKGMVEDEGSIIRLSPRDFSIYRIGTFNKKDGHLKEEDPTLIVRASAIIKKGETDEILE